MLVRVKPNYPTTPIAKIPLSDGSFAIVDPEQFEELNKHKWYAKKSFHCWYACRRVTENGKTFLVRMHRVIAKTPDDMVCHHNNKNSLDNRAKNLQNMSYFDHTKMHSWR